MTPAHETGNFAELVCTNSLRSKQLNNAAGLLKEEMKHLDSIVIKSAFELGSSCRRSLSSRS